MPYWLRWLRWPFSVLVWPHYPRTAACRELCVLARHSPASSLVLRLLSAVLTGSPSGRRVINPISNGQATLVTRESRYPGPAQGVGRGVQQGFKQGPGSPGWPCPHLILGSLRVAGSHRLTSGRSCHAPGIVEGRTENRSLEGALVFWEGDTVTGEPSSPQWPQRAAEPDRSGRALFIQLPICSHPRCHPALTSHQAHPQPSHP